MFEFEWDPAKAASNLRKHGVSFDDAATVLADDLYCRRWTMNMAVSRSVGFRWAGRARVNSWWWFTPTLSGTTRRWCASSLRDPQRLESDDALR